MPKGEKSPIQVFTVVLREKPLRILEAARPFAILPIPHNSHPQECYYILQVAIATRHPFGN